VQVRDLARAHTEKSLETLAYVRDNSKNDLARVRAAESLLNRGWGQPTTYVETTNSLAEEIDKIKRRAAPFPPANDMAHLEGNEEISH
jgi:hypothetical protein